MKLDQNILPNCFVTLEGTEHTYEGNSGPEGILSFDDIAEDVYTLIVHKDGYEDYIEEGIIVDDQNKSLRAKVSLTKLPEEITIIVITEPEIEDILVTLIDVQGNVIHHGRTDLEGQVIFPKVHFGKYALKVKSDEYQRFTTNITVNRRNNNPRTINIPLTPLFPEKEEELEEIEED